MIRILATCALVFSANTLGAFEIEQCNRSLDGQHFGETDYESFKGGFVLFSFVAAIDGEDYSSVQFVHCKSGTTLTAVPYEAFRDNEIRSTIVNAVASDKSYSFEDLEMELAPVSSSTSIKIDTDENCGCAAKYSLSRGDRKPFRLEGWN